MSTLTHRIVRTAKGTTVRVLEGGTGPDVLFLHDVTGPLADTSFLERLAETHHVLAPEHPGYGESTGEELLEDMLDFTLHAWDVVNALGLDRPAVIGHGMGGMIAAEMAAVNPGGIDRLILAAPLGIWLDQAPIPDLFSMLPYEFPRVLFADPEVGTRILLDGGDDFADHDALREFHIGNTRRLGTAGKILFPIPARRVEKRLYRVSTPTYVLWGESDALVTPVYAAHWASLMPDARVETVAGAGHMLPYERPDAFCAAARSFLTETMTDTQDKKVNP